jgi:hypothetical protein
MGETFEIKVGAKSAGSCALRGRVIEVRNERGMLMATGFLGDTPWPGTDALYWTALQLPAPNEEGLFAWSVEFSANELDIPHEGTSSKFSLVIAKPPQHRLTVKILDKDAAVPVEDAQVRLGAYRAVTDPAGLAEVRLPKGKYDVIVWKAGYEAPATALEVDADATIAVEVLKLPEENPDDVWKM